MRRIICMRRTESEDWGLILSRDPSLVFDGELRVFREAAFRNIDRARRRWLRLLAPPIAEELGPKTLPDGAILQVFIGR